MIDHPNLTPEINAAINESELLGGAYVKHLPLGRTLRVTTHNTVYLIKRVAEGEDGLTIQGSAKYCPEPIPAHIIGSNFGGSMLKVGFVGRGMYLEFVTDKHPGTVVTSQIQEVEEVTL